MRRKEKAIEERAAISEIIGKCQVCRLALCLDDQPYIVPVSFGYDETSIYFHSARAGKKIDILAVNANVCFEFELEVAILPDETAPCEWTFSFQSVIGFGKVKELSTAEEKRSGLAHIMQQYSDKNWNFGDSALSRVRVFRIVIDSMTGKQSPPPEKH